METMITDDDGVQSAISEKIQSETAQKTNKLSNTAIYRPTQISYMCKTSQEGENKS
jgi:hypothetical protein